jgi:hypothetical protein
MLRSALFACFFAPILVMACGGSTPTTQGESPANEHQATPGNPIPEKSDSGIEEPVYPPPKVEEPAPAGTPITAEEKTWTWVPIPEAKCMDGSSTGIGVNLSSSTKKVAIVLEGGGACFDDTTCTVGTIHQDGFDASTFAVVMAGMGYSGILNRNLPNNPLSEWSYVFVPYCTGDVHAGNNPSGPKGRMHVGFENIRHALERVVPTFRDATQVVLTGSSAGGVGAAYNYDQVQKAFGAVPVTLIDDSGPVLPDAFLKPCLQEQFREAWNMNATLPADCPDCRKSDGGGLINLAVYLGKKYPTHRFGMISSTADAVMRTFFGFGWSADCKSPGYFPPDQFEKGLVTFKGMAADYDAQFHVFYPRSEMHTWLLTDIGLSMSQSGVVLSDWLTQMVNGSASWKDVP